MSRPARAWTHSRRAAFCGGALALGAALASGCPLRPSEAPPAAPVPGALAEPGWCPSVRARLDALLAAHAGEGLPVVFDFDNTLACRDIGEATCAVLVRDGLLSGAALPPCLSPPFRLPGEARRFEAERDLLGYLEGFEGATAHSPLEEESHLQSYGWLVQILAGLTPADIAGATERAYGGGAAAADRGRRGAGTRIAVPGGRAFAVPFLYPEMVELVAACLRQGYEVWVISASNVWSVRWMVTGPLAEALRARGVERGIAPERVIGISTLLRGPGERLEKDPLLVRADAAYAALEPTALARYALTAQIVYPLPGYHGKSANIDRWIGRAPYLVAGDSPNDHPMLARARHRLWIARLEKPAYQRLVAAKADGTWIVQPTLTGEAPGFLPGWRALAACLGTPPAALADSVAALRGAGLLDEEEWNSGAK